MLGQSKDERADLKDLHDVHSDEVLHELYQELSRGNVRNINRGKAGEMHVFVGGWKVKTLERLGSTQVFHGAKLTHRVDLDSDTVKNVEDDNFVQAARATIEIMRKQSDDKLSAVKIKPLVAARVSFDLTERVWKEAMRTLSGTHKTISLVSDLHVAGWQRQGRSFVKFTSEF